MRDLLDERDNGVVIGSRSKTKGRKWFRILLSKCFNILTRVVGVKNIKDTQCGFKLFSRNSTQKILENLHIERYAFDVDLLFISQHFNFPVAEVEVVWKEIQGSKLPLFKSTLEMFFHLLKMKVFYSLGFWKLK